MINNPFFVATVHRTMQDLLPDAVLVGNHLGLVWMNANPMIHNLRGVDTGAGEIHACCFRLFNVQSDETLALCFTYTTEKDAMDATLTEGVGRRVGHELAQDYKRRQATNLLKE